MVLREPVLCRLDLSAGRLAGASGRYVKTLAQLDGLYEDTAAFTAARADDRERTVYEVTEFRPSDWAGDLIHGVTRMAPGRIGREFFLTRGHIHAIADRPEIYRGEAGQGVMLLESPAGETRALPINAGDVCYVPPYWIHRSVNIGAVDLVMSFAYPADSGQDYDIIARSGGMRSRVVADDDGGWVLAANVSYRPRSPAVVDALLAGAR